MPWKPPMSHNILVGEHRETFKGGKATPMKIKQKEFSVDDHNNNKNKNDVN